jgi:hypothetical protein
VRNMRRTGRAVIAAMSLIASLVLIQVALPGTAHARCNGVNTEATVNLVILGETVASENPIAGTCNNNNYYQGGYKSQRSGWRASVWIERNGWIGFFGPYGTALQAYEFHDNSTAVPGSVAMHLCLDNGTTWYCGVNANINVGGAVNHSITVINHGF